MIVLTTVLGWIGSRLYKKPPSVEAMRPVACPLCQAPAREFEDKLTLIGHGLYRRQVRGFLRALWREIVGRRFLCKACGHTCIVLPAWVCPRRWYTAPSIVEALWRHYVLGQPARVIAERFAWAPGPSSWPSLRRWGKEFLYAATLWSWLGKERGVPGPAKDRGEIRERVEWFLKMGAGQIPQDDSFTSCRTVRRAASTALRGLGYHRGQARLVTHDRRGGSRSANPPRSRTWGPTESVSRARASP